MLEEAIAKGMDTPSHYNSVDQNLIKNRVLATKIMKPKTDKPENKIEKNNSPNPHTYLWEE